MVRLTRRRLLAALALLAALVVVAVIVASQAGGDDDGAAAKPTSTATATPFPGGTLIEAVSYYVTNVGLSGTKYAITTPVNCNAFFDPEDAKRLHADGKICLDLNSGKFDDKSGTITVNLFGRDKSWDLTLEVAEGAWRVTDAEAVSPTG